MPQQYTHMERELKKIIKVWVWVFASLSYCYFIARRIPKGKFRLMSLIPIFCLFLLLPLNFSTIHLRGFTAFFLAWIANFKLLLFAFGQGPLSLDPSMPLLHFIFVAHLPIIIKHKSPPGSNSAIGNPSPLPTRKAPKSPLNSSIKVILIAVGIHLYGYRQYLHPHIQGFICCSHAYLGVETLLEMVAYLTRLLLGVELEPAYKEPYFSTSLQDFWSRRWNLMVTKILHPTVYEPTRCLAAHLLHNKSESIPQLVAIINTFLVSGLMHELLFFYMGCWQSTWKIMIYFSLHGVCLAAEVAMKAALANKWQLHPAVSCPLVIWFLFSTISWLLLPVFLQCQLDIKGLSEYKAFVDFIKKVGGFGASHGPQ